MDFARVSNWTMFYMH